MSYVIMKGTPVEQIGQALNGIRLPPQVVKLRYTIDNDWTGDPSLYFWLTVADEAAISRESLHHLRQEVQKVIFDAVNPMREWGLTPYFYVRTQSEQAQLKDEAFG
jgi:hypothetical protein